jgi:hypothetical protein
MIAIILALKKNNPFFTGSKSKFNDIKFIEKPPEITFELPPDYKD